MSAHTHRAIAGSPLAALLVRCPGLVMVLLDQTAVGVAIPTIVEVGERRR